MNWYIAKIIFRICNGEGSHKPQFDEHLRLIQASNFEEAFLKARILGLQEEATFLNNHLDMVKWEFVNVSELFPMNELKDGVELYSQIQEKEEAEHYIHYVHQKAAAIQLKHRPVF